MKSKARFSISCFLPSVRSVTALCGLHALSVAGVLGQGIRVTVELDKSVNVLTASSFGLPADMFDGGSFDPAAAPYTRLAGATTIRYPGNPGVADLYHWSTHTLTSYHGSDTPYINPDSNFGKFANNLDKFGNALLVVNYGANLDGTGGGDAGEAAAWVAYANGDPADTRPIAKDKNGDDWHTVGFWAALRDQSPLAGDDGFNFLRIAHPHPLRIALWQIGDQVYNNGFYGEKHTGDPDLHAPAPASAKDLAKLQKNPALGPASYGARLAEFARAMKAVDPSIKIGAALAEVDGSPSDADWNTKMWALDWNDKVLKAACGSIDFVTLDWQVVSLSPPDWKTLNESDLLGTSRQKLSGILNGMLDLDKRDCPADRQPRIAFAPAAVASWPHVEHPVAITLWVADTYAELAETGTQNTNWYEMHGNSMLSADNKSFGPAFMGLEMLHIVAHNPGDVFVQAASGSPLLQVHATRRRDGVLGLMLVNEDPKSAATATVTMSGGPVGSKGRRFDFGQEQQKNGAPLAQSEMTGLGGKFTLTIPPYTVTDILIPPGS
jgi:hypothetical protein